MALYQFLRFNADAVHIEGNSLDDLPRSARITFETIVREGPLSMPQLRAICGVPYRTLRFAIHRLLQQEFLDGRRNLQDARTIYYFVHRRRIRPQALEAARVRAEAAASHGYLIEVLGPLEPTAPARHVPVPAI